MMKRVLLFGHTGKMGIALGKELSLACCVIGMNSADFDAMDFDQVSGLVDKCSPDVIVNTVAFQGIDACEREPAKAFRINTQFPGHLAKLASKRNIPIVHFSSDAVFNDEKQDFHTEVDIPAPVNIYGVTKYGGDCLVQGTCERHYIFRIPILFGECHRQNQFVEKMLASLDAGQSTIRVSANLVSSPTYSLDVARHIRELLWQEAPFGVYHVANEGKASLYDLMTEVVSILKPGNAVERALFQDFPSIGTKNTYTPLRSVRTRSLRPWREAVREYCHVLSGKG